MNKIAFITGANKGLGKEIARQLGQQNITVLVGSRDLANGEEAAAEFRAEGAEAVAIQVDVTDQTSVGAAAEYITKTYGRLDILVNNAGIAVHSEAESINLDAFKQIYEVNVFGVVRTIEAMLPLLKKSAPGSRIINVSTEMGSFQTMQDPTNDFYDQHLPAYSSSKTAVNAITVQCAKILSRDGIAVNAMNPGFIDTDMNNHMGTRPPEDAAKTATWLATIPESPSGKFYFDRSVIAW